MIKSIRQQTKIISTNWYQLAKYLIVFIVGLLICRGININRNYEYLNTNKATVYKDKSGKSISSNNFKPGKSPFPTKMPSPVNSSGNNGPIKMPSPVNSSGETGLDAQCRGANWIPRDECNSNIKIKNNSNAKKNNKSSVFRGFGLSAQIGSPNSKIEGYTNGALYEPFMSSKVSSRGYRPSPNDSNLMTIQHGESEPIETMIHNPVIEELSTKKEKEKEKSITGKWQCNQYKMDTNESDPTCILVNQKNGEAIESGQDIWTSQGINSNPFTKLCNEPGAKCDDMTEKEINALWRKSYDGEENTPWWLQMYPGSILEDIRAPGYKEEESCNTMIYKDKEGVLDGILRCHNNTYSFKKNFGIGIVITSIILCIVSLVIFSNSKGGVDTSTNLPIKSNPFILIVSGMIAIVTLFYTVLTSLIIFQIGINSPTDGEGDKLGPDRGKCSDFSGCPPGYENTKTEFGDTVDVCCKPIVGTCADWWENENGGCSGGQVNYEGHAGIIPGINEEQDICCAMSCENDSDCDVQVNEECKNKICVCKGGYGVSATGSCEETCDTWNNGSLNDCPPGKNFINGDKVPGDYLEECCGDFECGNIDENGCNGESDKGCGWYEGNCVFKCGNITDDDECVGDCIWDSTAEPGVCKDTGIIPP